MTWVPMKRWMLRPVARCCSGSRNRSCETASAGLIGAGDNPDLSCRERIVITHPVFAEHQSNSLPGEVPPQASYVLLVALANMVMGCYRTILQPDGRSRRHCFRRVNENQDRSQVWL